MSIPYDFNKLVQDIENGINIENIGKNKICAAITEKISNNIFITQQNYEDLILSIKKNKQKNNDLITQFKIYTLEAYEILLECFEIIIKINPQIKNDILIIDKTFIEYIGSNDYNNLQEEKKKTVNKTIYNLFRNQLYLMAFLICKFAPCEKDKMSDFNLLIFEKIEALNKIKRPFIEELKRKINEEFGQTNKIKQSQNIVRPEWKIDGLIQKNPNYLKEQTAKKIVVEKMGGGYNNSSYKKILYKSYKYMYIIDKLYQNKKNI